MDADAMYEAADFLVKQRKENPEQKSPRVVADHAGWERIRELKLGSCRICSDGYLPQLHHLVSRAQRGSDVADNLVSLCARCHREVEAHDEHACRQLGLNLTDAELAYITARKYEGYAGDRYGKDAA